VTGGSRSISSVAILMGAALAAPSPAHGLDGTEPFVPGSVRVVSVAGTPLADGGCSYRLPELRLAPGQSAVRADEIAQASGCSATFAEGTPAGAEVRGAPTAPATAGSPCGASRSAGRLVQWTTDPVGIPTNADRSNVTWDWDCVSASFAPDGCSGSYWVLVASGWQVTSPGSACGTLADPPAVFADWTYVAGNDVFCPVAFRGKPTFVTYSQNRVIAGADGTLGAETVMVISGGCHRLLRAHVQLTRTSG
jgi:hypothetical protein